MGFVVHDSFESGRISQRPGRGQVCKAPRTTTVSTAGPCRVNAAPDPGFRRIGASRAARITRGSGFACHPFHELRGGRRHSQREDRREFVRMGFNEKLFECLIHGFRGLEHQSHFRLLDDSALPTVGTSDRFRLDAGRQSSRDRQVGKYRSLFIGRDRREHRNEIRVVR